MAVESVNQIRRGEMTLFLAIIGVVLAGGFALFQATRKRWRDEILRNSVTPDALYALWTSDSELLIFDVRQPLDLLAYPEIIPRARRVPPAEVLEKPSLIPKDKDAVVYCTCPGDKTSREVIEKARAMQLFRVKFLEGGLAGWKAKGYPVEPYREVFHLYRAAGSPAS
jgi:rhodanese-related sulfurtransferase